MNLKLILSFIGSVLYGVAVWTIDSNLLPEHSIRAGFNSNSAVVGAFFYGLAVISTRFTLTEDFKLVGPAIAGTFITCAVIAGIIAPQNIGWWQVLSFSCYSLFLAGPWFAWFLADRYWSQRAYVGRRRSTG